MISRRHFLQALSGTALTTLPPSRWTFAGSDKRSPQTKRFLLSEEGCGRATGYAEANKIVTSGDKTHVAWLDSPKEGFRVRVRTLDRNNDRWSPTYTVGEAYDNHGGPALTIDSRGFLHIVYYPHHHAMRYRRSKRPNDASQWEEEIQFGQRCTYPTLVCGPDDTLYFTCRRSFSDRPWQVELWTLPSGGKWQRQRSILKSRYKGYAHFQESLVWGPDHQTLHLCCRFHEKTNGGGYGRLQTVAYLYSRDFGKTWHRSDGTQVKTPVPAESADILAKGGVDHERVLRAGALTVDSSNRPHIVYSLQEEDRRGRTFLARPQGDGTWRRTDLTQTLPEEYSSWDLIMPGGISFTGAGELVGTAMLQKVEGDESSWGHPTSEVVQFRSRGEGKMFSWQIVSQKDRKVPYWLPNIERSTGHHSIPDSPGIIYTSGGPGEKNTQLLSNRVFFVRSAE